MKAHLAAAFSILAISGTMGVAEEALPLWAQAPTTISPEWNGFFAEKGRARDQAMPAPDDMEGWRTVQAVAGARNTAAAEALATSSGIAFRDTEIGGVPVVEIIPADPVSDDRIGVYTHGGAYTVGVAKTPQAVLFAMATGLKVISIEYTLAPQAQWNEATGEVVSVFSALAGDGIRGRDIVLAGDSAGGGLAAGSVLRMRDEGVEMPAALVLWSPWADITETGDTYSTLRDADVNYTYENVLGPAAIAYAAETDQRNPYVSPVYGDFAAGFPPTLIQGGGTGELFARNFILLYQSLDQSGQTVKLDLYEGMPHVFMAQMPETPEAKLALAKTGAWVDRYLLQK